MAGLKFDIIGNANGYIAATRQAEMATKSMTKSVEKEGNTLDSVFKKMAVSAGAYFSFTQIDNYRKKLIEVRGDFQKLEIAFSTMLQSEEKGFALMNQLAQTAAKTPFDLKGISEGAKQLLAYGTAAEDVNDTIVRLGNIASGLSIPLNDLVYLYGTTMVQGRLFTQDLKQFQGRGIPLADELAKQLGVAKEKISEMVTAGEIGFPQVQKALEAMTDEGGKFFQLMEKQSSSLSGMKSNLDDAVDMMLNQMGKDMQGVLAGSIELTTKLVENYKQVGQSVLDIVVAYGAYKAALLSITAIRSASTNLAYSIEIEELRKLIPLQEMSAYADINAAVASGKLTKEKAEQVIALREEAKAHVANLTAIADEAAANAVAALNAKSRNAEEIEALKLKIIKLRESGKSRAADALAMEMQSLEIRQTSLAEAAETAVLEANTARTTANTAATNLNTVSETANAKATNVLMSAKQKLSSVIKRLGDVIKANPLMLYATAIAATVTAIYKLATAADTTEVALNAVADRMAEINEEGKNYKSEVEGLISTIKDETASNLQRMEAYEKLSILFPELTNRYSMAEIAAIDFANAQRQINDAVDDMKVNKLKDAHDYYTGLTIPEKTFSGALKKAWELNSEAWDKSSFWEYMSNFSGPWGALNQSNFANKMARNYAKELDAIKQTSQKAEFEAKPFEIKVQIREGEVEKAKSDLLQAKQDLLDWASQPKVFGFDLELPVGPEFDKRMAGKTEQEISAEQDRIISDWQKAGYGNLPFGLLFRYNESKKEVEKAIGMLDELRNSADKTPDVTLDALMSKLPQLRQELAQLQRDNASKDAIEDKKEEIKLTEEDILVKEKQISAIKDVKKQIQSLQTEQENYAANSAEYVEIQRRINALQKKLPKTQEKEEDKKSEVAKAKEDQLSSSRQAARDAKREREDLASQVEQADINAEVDAEKKKRRQRELDHRLELQQIERQKEDYIEAVVQREKDAFEASEAVKKAQNENYKAQTFDYNASKTKVSASDEVKQFDKIYQDTRSKQWSEIIAAELDAWNQYLEEYGTFEQKKLAITIKYEKLIKDAATHGEKASLAKQMEGELYELEREYKKTATAIQDLFGDLREKSAKDLNTIADEGEKALNFIKTGKWSADNAFGISEETFNKIKSSPSDLEEIAKAILGIRKQADELEDPIQRISEGFKELFESESGTEAFEKALSKIVSGVNEITDAIGFVSDSLGSMGEALGNEGLGKAAEGIESVLSVVDSTMSGTQAGAAFGPWGAAAGAALGLVTGLVTEISKAKDAVHQEEIDRLAGEIEDIEKDYDDLGKSIEKAYSVDASDLIDQQNILLEQKKANLRLMIAEEEEKKNSNEEQIKQWKSEIDEVESTIEENAEKAQEAIIGISFDDFRNNFLDALLDMEEGAEGFAKSIEEDIRRAMYDALLTDDVFESQMNDLYDDLAAAIEAGDTREIDRIKAAILNLYDKQEKKAKEIDEKLGYEGESSRSSTEKGIAQASQGSVDELNGRMTAIQSHTFSINEKLTNLVSINAQILGRVSSIDNKASRLEDIDKSIDRMQSDISDILTKGIKIKS